MSMSHLIEMQKLLIKNLFNNNSISMKANHTYASIKSNCKYNSSNTYSLMNMFQINQYDYIIGINNFCLFLNYNLVDFIKKYLKDPIDIVLPHDIQYPLQLVPFCMRVNVWTRNVINQYLKLESNNLFNFLEQSNLLKSSNILYTKEWSSYSEGSTVLNLINHKIEDINKISNNHNKMLGII